MRRIIVVTTVSSSDTYGTVSTGSACGTCPRCGYSEFNCFGHDDLTFSTLRNYHEDDDAEPRGHWDLLGPNLWQPGPPKPSLRVRLPFRLRPPVRAPPAVLPNGTKRRRHPKTKDRR